MDTPVVYSRKVRFSDTDCQGHVFHVNYFVYFDDAVTDYFDALGLPHHLFLGRGHDLVLARAECDFRSSATLGETLDVRVEVEKIGTTSLVFALSIEEEKTGRRVAAGREVYVVLDTATRAPTPVPDYLRAAVAGTAV